MLILPDSVFQMIILPFESTVRALNREGIHSWDFGADWILSSGTEHFVPASKGEIRFTSTSEEVVMAIALLTP